MTTSSYYRLWFIEVLKKGEWVRTFWTCSPDEPEPKPALSILARRRLKVAQKTFPHATYRLTEVPPEPATTTTASPHDTTALALPRFETMQEGSTSTEPPYVVVGRYGKKEITLLHG